jgi:hypothetical protein
VLGFGGRAGQNPIRLGGGSGDRLLGFDAGAFESRSRVLLHLLCCGAGRVEDLRRLGASVVKGRRRLRLSACAQTPDQLVGLDSESFGFGARVLELRFCPARSLDGVGLGARQQRGGLLLRGDRRALGLGPNASGLLARLVQLGSGFGGDPGGGLLRGGDDGLRVGARGRRL